MDEDIYGPRVPHLKGKTVRHKFQHVVHIIVPNSLKGIIDRYKKATLFCDLMHIKGIGFLNNISRHIMFATVMKTNKNIEDGIKQINKLYLQRGFKTTRINYDSEFEPLQSEISDIGIPLNCVSKK